MSIVERVIWTALPKEVTEDGRIVVSVHVAPRLMTDPPSEDPLALGDFPFFRDWPSRLAELEWAVFFDGEEVAGTPITKADPELWSRIFPTKTPTRPHEFSDHAQRDIHTYPVRTILQFLEETYGGLSAAGPDLPSIDNATGPLAPFGPLGEITDQMPDDSFWAEWGKAQEKAQQAKERPESEEATKPVGSVVSYAVVDASLPASQQPIQEAMFLAYRFYHRPGSQRPDLPEDYIEPPPQVPEFDFHEIVSLLADHPVLLRRLGLVIDLVVEHEDPFSAFAAEGVLKVEPRGELPEEPRCPGTFYELDVDWFGARPQSSHIMRRGLLGLSQDVWDLFQVDVDGAALQAVGFGATLEAMLDPERRNQDTPAETGAPALRSAGLALARLGRGEGLLGDLVARREANDGIAAGEEVAFSAEDLVRGYRVDVWDENAPSGPRWHSLHERVTAHTVTGLSEPLEAIEDEGYIKATTASSEREDHEAPSDDLYLHETVVSWDGWSLAAPRPGKRIVEPGEGENGTSVAAYDPAAGKVTALVSDVGVAKGSLPRLRVGHTYKLRVRTVDLAGNSRPVSPDDLDPGDPDLESEAQMFVRFEPVPSPTILRRHLDTEGESLEHLVIRSDQGMTAAEYAKSEEVTAALEEAGIEYTYREDSERHLAAPKGSAQMAEQDGKFEDAFQGDATKATSVLRLALREEGTFLDPLIVDPATGKKTEAQTQILLSPSTATLPLPTERGTGLRTAPPANEELPGAYAYYPDEEVHLPYLPDPLAIGVALSGVNATGTNRFYEQAIFPDDWPRTEPIRLRLSAAADKEPISLEFKNRILEVRLPQAEVLHGHLSSIFPEDRLGHFAIWQWTPEQAQGKLKADALKGLHWMLTPFRRVTFTHAVQRPLEVPNMTAVLPSRVLGSTFAEFSGPIANHALSTGHLDVLGEWSEDVDLLTDDVPRMRATGNQVEHSAHAFGFDLGPDEDMAQVTKLGTKAKPPIIPLPTADRIARHEFGDTKYRRVLYHSVATTRFREYLPASIAADPARIQQVEETWIDEGTKNDKLVHDILSSARPAAPDVLYVLPTFRWERNDDAPVRTHVRRGKAVRVWLRRPWFSSGDGELLGVVLEPAVKLFGSWKVNAEVVALQASTREMATGSSPRTGTTRSAISKSPDSTRHLVETNPASGLQGVWLGTFSFTPPPTPDEIRKMLQPYVTKWGSDPVWSSRLPDTTPSSADFPRRVATKGGLTLEEVAPEARVTVVAHPVYFDTDRKLWYSDIEIEMGDSYYPFVRLALARFQPNSLDDAHLSRVTMTDFMQLAPDRTAELWQLRGGYGVKVRGYSGRNIAGVDVGKLIAPELASKVPQANTIMRAALERRPPEIPGELGWQQVGGEVMLKATATTDFHVTWTGTVPAGPPLPAGHAQRIVITESERFPRDPRPGDPYLQSTPNDLLAERVVYADIFEL